MFLISTRNFPPDVGGIQNLMEGLSNALLNHGPVKVFADSFENSKNYDLNSKLDIQRISGFKIFKKYRKANLVKEFINDNDIRAVFFDHWKSLENIEISALERTKSFCLIHSKEINHPIGSSLNKRVIKVLSNVEKVIANSEYTQNLAINNGVDQDRVIVINPGADPVQELNKKSLEKVESLL